MSPKAFFDTNIVAYIFDRGDPTKRELAKIVACAVESRCQVLFTEDLQHGQVIAGVRIENPLRDATLQ